MKQNNRFSADELIAMDQDQRNAVAILKECDGIDDNICWTVLSHAVDVIRRSRFSLAYRVFQTGPSAVSWSDKTIWIALGDPAADNTSVLWDLAHELGHLEIGEPAEHKDPHFLSPDEKKECLKREGLAWDKGWQMLLVFDNRIGTYDVPFNKRRRYCLGTYE